MKISRLMSVCATFILLLTIVLFPSGLTQVASAAAVCVASNGAGATTGAYTVTICLTAPAGGATLTGNVPITATASIVVTTAGGVKPSVQRMVFYLNGVYVLTDFQSPYTFIMPTARWVDGTYTLQIGAVMRDGFATQKVGESVVLKNGVVTPPVNINKFAPTTGRLPAAGAPFVVVATGDGAGGEVNSTRVTNLIASINPNLFLYLGDVYDQGTPSEFNNWYGTGATSFSQFNAITDPTVGNHEYLGNSHAAGYFYYWNNVPSYYSFNAGGWHFISLNSNIGMLGSAAAAAQLNWLKADLAAHPTGCTIAFYHHPYFNIGPEKSSPQVSSIWGLLAQNHVDIVLNGHDHDYQRWVPLDGNGVPSASGITEFISGGGGHAVTTLVNKDTRVAYSNGAYPTALGALKLTLGPASAAFSYMSINGTALDSGTIPCH